MAKIGWGSSVFLVMILFVIPKLTSSAPTFRYNYCSNTTTFAAADTSYPKNLNAVFNSLSSAAAATATATSNTGFATASAGNGTSEAVFGLFLCRGDQTPSSCSDCVATAVRDQPKTTTCPRSKVGIIWYDECMIRYDDENFFGRMDQSPRLSLSNTQNITGNRSRFTELLGDTMKDLAVQTAKEGAGKKYGTRVVSFTSLQTVYELEQCTPDLSDSDCDQCLTIAIGQMVVMQGARILLPSCNVRYEIYPFFNGATNISSPPPSSPPPAITNSSAGVGSAPGDGKKVSTKVIIAIVVTVVAAAITVALLVLMCIRSKKKISNMHSGGPTETGGEYFSTIESLQYDLPMLQSATNYFSDDNKLGEGGFGGVYKGTLPNGQEVAVKRLSRSSGQGAQEFKNEVLLVAKLQHRNLVKLLGFCLDGEEKLLVYEYVPNKSLDCFLFDPEKQGQLDWGRRYKIIGGIARGLLYLHQDSRLRIIHRDLKASNVLLDADMNPKISDFGLAKIVGVDQTQGNTNTVVGTYGYMSPEYAMHGQFSTKSDVYSFGVLVLEIISGKKNSTFYQSDEGNDLLSYGWKQWRDGMPLDFVDPMIRDSCSSHEVMRCMHLGLLCTQESVDKRPTMATIVLMLDSHSVTLPVPERPTFLMKSRAESSISKETGSNQSSSKSAPWSVNDVSITEFHPR